MHLQGVRIEWELVIAILELKSKHKLSHENNGCHRDSECPTGSLSWSAEARLHQRTDMSD